ncbi:MAG: transposase [Alphaproteobacteria bacterium]|nr:transposase [Alphaproteobacteria bacterium]
MMFFEIIDNKEESDNKCFLPEVQTGTTIVMDNVSFYKASKTKKLIEKEGCNLLYLLLYSSDYKPIENQLAVLMAYSM